MKIYFEVWIFIFTNVIHVVAREDLWNRWKAFLIIFILEILTVKVAGNVDERGFYGTRSLQATFIHTTSKPTHISIPVESKTDFHVRKDVLLDDSELQRSNSFLLANIRTEKNTRKNERNARKQRSNSNKKYEEKNTNHHFWNTSFVMKEMTSLPSGNREISSPGVSATKDMAVFVHPLTNTIGSKPPITIEITPSNETLITVYFASVPQDLAILLHLPSPNNKVEESAILITVTPGNPPSYSGTITFILPTSNSTVGFNIPPSPNGAVITVDAPQGIEDTWNPGKKVKIRLVHLATTPLQPNLWPSSTTVKASSDILSNNGAASQPSTVDAIVISEANTITSRPTSVILISNDISTNSAHERTEPSHSTPILGPFQISTHSTASPITAQTPSTRSFTGTSLFSSVAYSVHMGRPTQNPEHSVQPVIPTKSFTPTKAATPDPGIRSPISTWTSMMTKPTAVLDSTQLAQTSHPLIISTGQGNAITNTAIPVTTTFTRPTTITVLIATVTTSTTPVATTNILTTTKSTLTANTSQTRRTIPITKAKEETTTTYRTVIIPTITAYIPSIHTTTITTPTSTTTTPSTSTTTTPSTTTTTPTSTTTTPSTTTTMATPTSTTTTPSTTTTMATPTSTTTTPSTTTTMTTPTSTTTTPSTTTTMTTPTSTTTTPSTTTTTPTSTTTTPSTTTTMATPTSTTTTPSTTMTTPTSTTTMPSTTTIMTTPASTTPTPSTTTMMTTTMPLTTTTMMTTTMPSTTTTLMTTTMPSTTTTMMTTTMPSTTATITTPTTPPTPTTTTTMITTTTSTPTITTIIPTTTSTPAITMTTPTTTMTRSTVTTTTQTTTTTIMTTPTTNIVTSTTPITVTRRSTTTTPTPLTIAAPTINSTATTATTIPILNITPVPITTMEIPNTQVTSSFHPTPNPSTMTPPATEPCPYAGVHLSTPASSAGVTLTSTKLQSTELSSITATKNTSQYPPPWLILRPESVPATYWLRTVIETRPNEVKINFTAEMQRSLQEAFEEAFTRQQLTPFGYIWRQKRQQHKRHQDKIMVQMINTTIGQDSKQTELVYFLYHNGHLIPVATALKAMEYLDDQEVALIFRHVVVIKAEQPTPELQTEDSKSVLLPAILGSIIALLLLILVVILIYKFMCKKKTSHANDSPEFGQRNRRQAFEEDVSSSVIAIGPAQGQKSEAANIWPPGQKPRQSTSKAQSTSPVPPIPKRQRRKTQHPRPLPTLPGDVDYANVSPVHGSSSSSIEKLVKESPDLPKRKSGIRHKKVLLDVHRINSDDCDSEEIPVRGGIFDHLKPPILPIHLSDSVKFNKESEIVKPDIETKKDELPQSATMASENVVKAIEESDRRMSFQAAATQTEELFRRSLTLERSVSYPEAIVDMELLDNDLQMACYKNKMQEILDEAFSFWKNRKMSPRFRRSNGQAENDCPDAVRTTREKIAVTKISPERKRVTFQSKWNYTDDRFINEHSHESMTDPSNINNAKSTEIDIGNSVGDLQNANKRNKNNPRSKYLPQVEVEVPPEPKDCSVNVASSQRINSNPTKLASIHGIPFMDQSITNEVSFQYMTPVNGDNEIDFVNRIRIQRDPETQYLIKAIKKELQRFRTTYSRDYSIV